MKKIILFTILTFMLFIPFAVKAEENWKDLYEAYKVNPNDERTEYILSERMWENPPKSIALKLINFSQGTNFRVPLEGTINVNLGESATYSTKIQFGDNQDKYDYDVTVTLNYKKEESGASFIWETAVDYKGSHYRYIPDSHSHAWIDDKNTIYKSTYNSGLVTHKDFTITMRTEDRKGLGAISFEIVGVNLTGNAGITSIIDTIASGDIGETVTAIISIIVIGALGFGAATVGVAEASSEASQNKEEKNKYQMIIYKNFGDKIKVGDKPGTVEARMIEITDKGEIERPDLTEHIEIFSKDNVITVSTPSLKGKVKTASVSVQSKSANSRARISNLPSQKEGIISFRFIGEGGEFQNNVKFKIVSESYIRLEDSEFRVLGTSSEKFELIYELIDFAIEPQVELVYKSNLFELALDKNKQGKNIIVAKTTEEAKEKKFEKFIHSFPCEIVAKNEKETVKEKFELQLCYEGIGTAYNNCNNNETPEEIKMHCFSDDEKDKREEKAARIPLCVMRWDETGKKLTTDEEATKGLNFEFVLSDSNNKNAKILIKNIKEAEIIFKIDTDKNNINMDNKYQPSIFMIYPEKNVTASDPEINVTINITDVNAEFEKLSLESKLIPQSDFKAMIKWFIEYSRGTYVDQFIKIGNVDTYHKALDFIDNRVYSESNIPYTPKKVDGKLDNHYEDGKWDVSRPTYVFLLDRSMPHQIGDFNQIQSLHHELCHAIEHQNGDSGNRTNGERHSYFIQYLSDVVHTLSDIERGKLNTSSCGVPIQSYYNVFYNKDNASPQTFSWFGVEYVPAPMLFGRYAEFENYGPSNIPDERKKAIAKYYREHYFPADLKAKKTIGARFKETTGPFKDAIWTIESPSKFVGMFSGVSLEHPKYEFETVKKAEWIPGTLTIKTTFRIKNKATKVTELVEVELNGGKLNPLAERYEVVDKFTVSWISLEKISDTVLGKSNIKTEAVGLK